jgi:YbbR domain-containing protein
VNRVLRLFTHNWPLKLAAVVLATMLYVGLVLSQSIQDFPGSVRIQPRNEPSTAHLAANLPRVTGIRYTSVGAASALASTDSFQATIDLANVDPNAGPTYVPIEVESVDPRFQVVDFEPKGVLITLDPVKSRSGIPVKVVQGEIPSGLDVRTPVVTPETVTVRGLASVVDRVAEVQANVVIEPSGLDIDRDVELIPVDALGDRLTPVDVSPTTAHIQIAVFSNLESRPLPVTPVLSGTPALGYQVTAITVDPLLVSVEGDADAILGLTQADTEAIQISGATQDVVKDVGLSLPAGVQPAGGVDLKVRVTVTIRPMAATRDFDAGIVLIGRQTGLDYTLSINHAIATIGGPLADIDRINPALFTLSASVGGLGPGTHDVTLVANLTTGLSLVTSDPPTVKVTVTVVPSPLPSTAP